MLQQLERRGPGISYDEESEGASDSHSGDDDEDAEVGLQGTRDHIHENLSGAGGSDVVCGAQRRRNTRDEGGAVVDVDEEPKTDLVPATMAEEERWQARKKLVHKSVVDAIHVSYPLTGCQPLINFGDTDVIDDVGVLPLLRFPRCSFRSTISFKLNMKWPAFSPLLGTAPGCQIIPCPPLLLPGRPPLLLPDRLPPLSSSSHSSTADCSCDPRSIRSTH